jgi:hypothetical protein
VAAMVEMMEMQQIQWAALMVEMQQTQWAGVQRADKKTANQLAALKVRQW